MNLLSIKNLHVKSNSKVILNGIDLNINAGEVHVIMGPNGSGKSTLANILAGKSGYEVMAGSIEYLGQDLLTLSADERANKGLFLAFQYPIEIPGVSNIYFLRSVLNAQRKIKGESPVDAMDFITLVKSKMQALQMDEKFLYRDVNVGFSGGEKKRNEVLQMSLLEPKLAILDEIDSGLDIDALRIVAQGVNALRNAERSFIVVTHYQRLLDYIVPDYVHILVQGKISKSGDKSLAHFLEQEGYRGIGNNG